LSSGFEQSLECGSLAEPPEASAAGDFSFRIEAMSYRVRDRVRVTFRYLFCLISDLQKRGVYVSFV